MKFVIKELIALVSALVLGLCTIAGCLVYNCNAYKTKTAPDVSFTDICAAESPDFSYYAHFSDVDTSYDPVIYLKSGSENFINALQNGKYNCLTKKKALFTSLFALNNFDFTGSFYANNKSGKSVVYFMVYNLFGKTYVSAESHTEQGNSISLYKCADKQVSADLAKFNEKNGISPRYTVWRNFYNYETHIEDVIKTAFIVVAVVSFATISVFLNLTKLIEFIKSKKKISDTKGEKKLSKALEILVLFAGGTVSLFVISFLTFAIILTAKDSKVEYVENLGNDFGIHYYMPIGNKVKMKEYNRLDDSMLFTDNEIKPHTVSRYYVKNEDCYSHKSYDEKKFFFGTDNRDLQLCAKFTDGYSEAHWYAREDYTVPSVDKNRIEKIIVAGVDCAESDLAKSGFGCFATVKNDKSNTESVTNEDTITTCVESFGDGQYNLSGITLPRPKTPSDYYIVLAAFEDSAAYQCLGFFD
ncbi:MAG: hypothetical protein MJ147_05285 [Clostridia bacterium]|nr:hypothetical protein [Clostridia bacterium]